MIIISCCLFRFVNEEVLSPREDVVIEYNTKESVYTLALTGDLKEKKGKIKIVAKNNGGEVFSEAELIISGQTPVFAVKPIKCTVLEGLQIHFTIAFRYLNVIGMLREQDRTSV